MKISHKVLLALPVMVTGYLAVAATWAWLAFPAAQRGLPPSTATLQLSPRQAEILLKVEDPTFFHHPGLALAAGHLTTITSSLARSIYLGDAQFDGALGGFQRFYRGVFDCCKKIDIGRDAMALVLDRKLTKEQQLAAYSALVYMGTQQGHQVRGFEDAALNYVGKPLGQLSEAEFVGLVAMVNAPNLYHPVRNPEAYRQRVAQVVVIVGSNGT